MLISCGIFRFTAEFISSMELAHFTLRIRFLGSFWRDLVSSSHTDAIKSINNFFISELFIGEKSGNWKHHAKFYSLMCCKAISQPQVEINFPHAVATLKSEQHKFPLTTTRPNDWASMNFRFSSIRTFHQLIRDRNKIVNRENSNFFRFRITQKLLIKFHFRPISTDLH